MTAKLKKLIADAESAIGDIRPILLDRLRNTIDDLEAELGEEHDCAGACDSEVHALEGALDSLEGVLEDIALE